MPAIRSIVTIVARYLLAAVLFGGLLLVPVRCPLVDHPHSIFSMPRLMDMDTAMPMPAGMVMSSHATNPGMMAPGMMSGMPLALASTVALERLPEAVVAVNQWLADQSRHAASSVSAMSNGAVSLAGQVLSPTGKQLRPSVDPVPMLILSDTLVALGCLIALLWMVARRIRRWPALPAFPSGRITGVLVPPPRLAA